MIFANRHFRGSKKGMYLRKFGQIREIHAIISSLKVGTIELKTLRDYHLYCECKLILSVAFMISVDTHKIIINKWGNITK